MNKTVIYGLLGLGAIALIASSASKEGEKEEGADWGHDAAENELVERGQLSDEHGNIVDWEVIKRGVAQYRGRWRQLEPSGPGEWNWVPSNTEPATRATQVEMAYVVKNHLADAGYTTAMAVAAGVELSK